jgi:hypothetical protein
VGIERQINTPSRFFSSSAASIDHRYTLATDGMSSGRRNEPAYVLRTFLASGIAFLGLFCPQLHFIHLAIYFIMFEYNGTRLLFLLILSAREWSAECRRRMFWPASCRFRLALQCPELRHLLWSRKSKVLRGMALVKVQSFPLSLMI